MHANTFCEHLAGPQVRPALIESDVLFIDDLAHILRASRTTIERRRRDRSLPFPELPAIDKRPRWSRLVVERFLSAAGSADRLRPSHRFAPTRVKA